MGKDTAFVIRSGSVKERIRMCVCTCTERFWRDMSEMHACFGQGSPGQMGCLAAVEGVHVQVGTFVCVVGGL